VIRVDQDDPNSMQTMSLVPSQFVGPFTASGGLIDRNNNPIPQGTNYPNGALLVGDIFTCERTKEGTPVLTNGKSCPLNVVLDATPGADTDLITQIQNTNVTLVNSNPKGANSTDVTGFADVVLRQNWTPNLQTALEYRRQQGNASGLGGTVVGDFVSLSNTWNWTEKWQFSVRGDWSLRNSVSESTRVLVVAQPVTSPLGGAAFAVPIAGTATGPLATGTLLTQRSDQTKIDTMRWGIATRATHFFTRNTSGYVQFTYNQQDSKSDSLGDPSDFKDYLVTVGVQHVFEPIKLW
jgi:hypothetical protein